MNKNSEIIVFSIYKDISTNEVIDWIYHYEGRVSRINTIKDVVSFLNNHPDIQLVERNNIDDEFCVWFRRIPDIKGVFE